MMSRSTLVRWCAGPRVPHFREPGTHDLRGADRVLEEVAGLVRRLARRVEPRATWHMPLDVVGQRRDPQREIGIGIKLDDPVARADQVSREDVARYPALGCAFELVRAQLAPSSSAGLRATIVRTVSSEVPRSSSRETILRNESVGSGLFICPRSEPRVARSGPTASIHSTSVSRSQL